MKPRVLVAALLCLLLAACAASPRVTTPPQLSLDQIADGYVRQVLALSEHDPDYLEIDYAPAAWHEQEHTAKRSLLNIRNVIARLYSDAETAGLNPDVPAELWELRRRNLRNQLGALDARARMLGDWQPDFDDESLALYDVSAPFYGREDFQPMLDALDALLPRGDGNIAQRFQQYQQRFVVPRDQRLPALQAAIETMRQRSFRHLHLPENETLELSLVNDQPWLSQARYRGQYRTELRISADRAITAAQLLRIAAREGYPGRHLAQVMTEDQLVITRGWKEFMVTPRRSPASFSSEGLAAYGEQLVLPTAARQALLKQLFSICGFDAAEVERYERISSIAESSAKASLEAARRYRDGQASADETRSWLQDYALQTSESAAEQLPAFDQRGADLIKPVYGGELIRQYVDRQVDDSEPEGLR